MKNRELMRLNKVLHKGEIKTVDCISPGYVSFIEDVPEDADFGPWVDLDEVEFVTLTEDWLLKFGFKNGSKEVSNCDLWDRHWVGDFEIEKQGGEFNYGSENVIKHVHQIQNLYFVLTGGQLKYNAI